MRGQDRYGQDRSMSEPKIARESIWLFGSYALSKFGRLAMMLVVAALLSPRLLVCFALRLRYYCCADNLRVRHLASGGPPQ